MTMYVCVCVCVCVCMIVCMSFHFNAVVLHTYVAYIGVLIGP